jgi:hypothetical protein
MTEEKNITPLFEHEDEKNGNDNDITAELFRDRVRSLHEYFDKNKDSYLNFQELAALQETTDGTLLSEEMYVMVCKALDCRPGNGISIDALRLTYASEGADIDKDYFKVFPERKPKRESKGEDHIYETIDGSIDIS